MRGLAVAAALAALGGLTVAVAQDAAPAGCAAAVCAGAPPPPKPAGVSAPMAPAFTAALIAAAREQVGVTVSYDPGYQRLAYPNGDVPRERGVCTDVLIRALRDSAGIDLQAAMHRDMTARFSTYPRRWGLKRPDPNIDHRRVPNLEVLLSHLGARVTDDTRAGDVVTVLLPGNLPHIMIVSDREAAPGRPLVIHNIGRGTREEDALGRYPETGHFRLSPAVLDGLRRLMAQDRQA